MIHKRSYKDSISFTFQHFLIFLFWVLLHRKIYHSYPRFSLPNTFCSFHWQIRMIFWVSYYPFQNSYTSKFTQIFHACLMAPNSFSLSSEVSFILEAFWGFRSLIAQKSFLTSGFYQYSAVYHYDSCNLQDCTCLQSSLGVRQA